MLENVSWIYRGYSLKTNGLSPLREHIGRCIVHSIIDSFFLTPCSKSIFKLLWWFCIIVRILLLSLCIYKVLNTFRAQQLKPIYLVNNQNNELYLNHSLSCIIFFRCYKRPTKKKLLNKLCKVYVMEYFATIRTESI